MNFVASFAGSLPRVHVSTLRFFLCIHVIYDLKPVKQILTRHLANLAKTELHWVQVLCIMYMLLVMQHLQH